MLGALACLLPGRIATAEEGAQGPLVTVQWLQAHRGDADLLVLDASPARLYAVEHIPGAVNADLMSYGIKEKPAADMARLYESWGVDQGRRIVLYDQGGTIFATRLFFSLYYDGVPPERLFVLDGGLSRWREQGLPVSTEVTPAPAGGSFEIEGRREEVRARLPEFLTASGDPVNNALLEALDASWHYGEVHVLEKAGHVPHAILLPADDFFDADETFKSPDQIRRMLAYLGVRPEQTVYTHCGGGVAASVPFFALKFLLGYPKVKLYTESEMGWLRDERELPYWTYDVPSLVRTANWLRFWGGPMLRTYGGVDVSIVDVRPKAEFDDGHVPFAIGIPAEVFRENLGSPGKLASILGAAGVDASHEAVVLSGAGLTKEAALAFVMLEGLGQRRASVLVDSFAQWAELGLALTKQATLVGPKTAARNLVPSPAAFAAKPREDVIVLDPTRTRGLFPKVFVASGAVLPVRAPEGKIVHVPYTDLLSADGRPKAAKEIWKILAEAGVPRYAEIVCYSDDPGEAAVNYFVLKLMGYPDVEVLLL